MIDTKWLSAITVAMVATMCLYGIESLLQLSLGDGVTYNQIVRYLTREAFWCLLLWLVLFVGSMLYYLAKGDRNETAV